MELCGNSFTFSFINIQDISWHSSIYSNREMLLLRGNILPMSKIRVSPMKFKDIFTQLKLKITFIIREML